MKSYTLNEVQDEILGKIGTPDRDKFLLNLNDFKSPTRFITKTLNYMEQRLPSL